MDQRGLWQRSVSQQTTKASSSTIGLFATPQEQTPGSYSLLATLVTSTVWRLFFLVKSGPTFTQQVNLSVCQAEDSSVKARKKGGWFSEVSYPENKGGKRSVQVIRHHNKAQEASPLCPSLGEHLQLWMWWSSVTWVPVQLKPAPYFTIIPHSISPIWSTREWLQ